MIPDLDKVSIYIRPGVTDMRKQVNGLSTIVSEQMDENPGSGRLFLFCSRDRKLIKSIWWDRNGFCLWQKRLEKRKISLAGNGRESKNHYTGTTDDDFGWY
jgi:transposase